MCRPSIWKLFTAAAWLARPLPSYLAPQDILARLPEHLVNEICKNIFHVCKESWSDLRAKCSTQAGGHSSMTGTA